MPVIEITIDELLKDYSAWAEVFADLSSGNTSKDNCDSCPPGIKELCTPPPYRTDVVEIIAAVNGQNDEDEWLGVFRLKDGRFLVASGWCDYTGWD